MSVLELKDISKIIENKVETLNILEKINLKIDKGNIVSIYGRSGVGKTTLLSIIGTLQKPSSGNMYFNNSKIDFSSDLYLFRRKNMGFVFQDSHLLPEFSILENLIIPQLINNEKYLEAKEKSEELLSLINLSNLSDRYPYQISGGEKQRVSLLRGIANNPDLIIADEPSANLDEKNCELLMELIVKLNSDLNGTFIIATHDKRFKDISNNIYSLFNGELNSNE